MPSYRRFVRQLPDPGTLPFPGNLIRLCTDCGLRQGCTAPVPGAGPIPSRVMFIGEAPGKEEDTWGFEPFVGQSGDQLNSLLSRMGLPRSSVYLTNSVHCRPVGNRDPSPAEITACSRWLNLEISLVRPEIIVTLGLPASKRILGSYADTMDHIHGRPVEADVLGTTRIVLPCYHPAASMHDSSLLRHLFDDFAVLRGLLSGRTVDSYTIKDEYPSPDYRVADTPDRWRQAVDEAREAGVYAIDIETVDRNKTLWSAQISTRPGTGWFLPAAGNDYAQKHNQMDCSTWSSRPIMHFYLNDNKWLNLGHNTLYADTMVEAYLLGLSQGLKDLAVRLCGVKMITYTEMVRPGQRPIALDYLKEAATREWPAPPMLEETKWDNKAGKIATKLKKPKHIGGKIAGIFRDIDKGKDIDPYARWFNIPQEERACVEAVLGVMPESALRDISFEDAVQYATRDADVTFRVEAKMREMIQEADMNLILSIDLGILPMVDTMMRTGMAVDIEHFRKLSREYDAQMRAKSTALASVVGHSFNPNSSAQVAEVIYNELKYPITGKTPTGLISTDDQELKKTGHPVAKGIIEYRRLQKMKSTYADALVELAVPDEEGTPRIHTTLKTTRTETGRLSCVPLDTQILTESGWRWWYEVSIGDRVLGYSLIRNAYEWTAVKSVYRGQDILGGLKIGNRRRKEELIYCTPNHKWVVALKQNSRAGYIVPDMVGIVESKHIGLSRSLTPIFQLDSAAPDGALDVSPEVAAIIGWALTDGHIISTSAKRRALSIRLKKPYSIAAVEKLLRSSGVAYNHATYQGKVGTTEDFYIGVASFEPIWSSFFDVMGPERFVLGLTTTARQAMFDAMMEADGNVDEKHNRWSKQSDSTARTVMELLSLLLGKRFSSRFYSTHNGAPVQELHFLGRNRYLSNTSYRVLSDELHEVWCPETELGTWVMRQGRHIAITGNSTGPNLQNQPTRSKEGKAIRAGFVVPAGMVMNEGDYGQIEVVTQAHIANCKGLIELFKKGLDPHTYTAHQIFGVSYEEAKQSKYRKPTKSATFGIIYLISDQGLSDQITEYISDLEMAGEEIDIEPWPVDRCAEFIKNWYQLYPEVRDYQMEQLAMARRKGYVEDMFHRRRYIPEVSSPIRSIQETGARMAANMPIQSSAQGIMKISMGTIWRELPKTDWYSQVKWLMQIHDSLVTETPEDMNITVPFLRWMRAIMVNAVKLKIPIRVDFKSGKNWSALKDIDLNDNTYP